MDTNKFDTDSIKTQKYCFIQLPMKDIYLTTNF